MADKKKKKKQDTPSLDFFGPVRDTRNALSRFIACEAWGVVMLLLTIVYVLGLSGHGGTVGEVLVFLVTPVIGTLGAWLLAIAMAMASGHLLSARRWSVAGNLTTTGFAAIPIVLAGWENVLYQQEFYWDKNAMESAGWAGLWLGRGLRFLVGETAVPVAALLLMIVGMLIMRISPKAVGLYVYAGLKKIVGFIRKPGTAERSLPQTVEIIPEDDEPEEEIEEILEVTAVPEPVAEAEPSVPPGSQMDLGLEEAPPLPRPKHYKLPPLKLLEPAPPPMMDDNYREIAAQRIIKTLDMFGISCEVCDIVTGPAVTRVEVVLGEGIRVKQVEGMEKDIAYNLPAKRVRVEAPIPGKTAVGIEFPNIQTNIVRLREVLTTPDYKKAKAPLTMALAKNLNNRPVLCDLGKMPHLLVAGQTGSGKSVCLHAIITSLLYRLTPDQLRLILIDPKMVEFGFYEGLPHLLTPVVNDVGDAVNALRWSVQEMRDRYKKLKKAGARNIQAYNHQVKIDDRMPYIVIVIDEMADLMAQEGFEIEACITSLTQLARAVGIHLILATQRPSVKIITGNIKGNIPARIALNVASYNDSRTIIDGKGAETLLGNGDMLFKPADEDTLSRAQGVYVDDDEIKRVVEFLSTQGEPEYDEYVTADHAPTKGGKGKNEPGEISDQDVEVLKDALQVFMNEGEASTSMLQSKLGLGYPRARRLMTQMEDMGLVGPKNGSKPREIIFSACRDAMLTLAGKSIDMDDPVMEENNVDEILTGV